MQLRYDLMCLSHQRWDFVFQRAKHLLSRFQQGRVLFVEAPVYREGPDAIEVCRRGRNIFVATPHLPEHLSPEKEERVLADLLAEFMADFQVRDHVAMYHSPLPLRYSRHLRPLAQVYDCIDLLGNLPNQGPTQARLEQELFQRVDVVFTGGVSLYEEKKACHPRVYPFPCSVDKEHFGRARRDLWEPQDQALIPHPRVGYFGVIDKRLNLELLDLLAHSRPDLHLVLVGPCLLPPEDLPQAPNLHYLGSKEYCELPHYLASWDVAMMPFAVNRATRFISPGQTGEYLAGGRPVVSTSIADVIRPYRGLVRVADSVEAFGRAIDEARFEDSATRQLRVDRLAGTSWDATWAGMQRILDATVRSRTSPALHWGRPVAAKPFYHRLRVGVGFN